MKRHIFGERDFGELEEKKGSKREDTFPKERKGHAFQGEDSINGKLYSEFSTGHAIVLKVVQSCTAVLATFSKALEQQAIGSYIVLGTKINEGHKK